MKKSTTLPINKPNSQVKIKLYGCSISPDSAWYKKEFDMYAKMSITNNFTCLLRSIPIRYIDKAFCSSIFTGYRNLLKNFSEKVK